MIGFFASSPYILGVWEIAPKFCDKFDVAVLGKLS